MINAVRYNIDKSLDDHNMDTETVVPTVINRITDVLCLLICKRLQSPTDQLVREFTIIITNH
jgi:hypothetical protein